MIKLHKNTPFLEMTLLGAKNWAFLSHGEGILKKYMFKKLIGSFLKVTIFSTYSHISLAYTERGLWIHLSPL
jgi:hypothetical protein